MSKHEIPAELAEVIATHRALFGGFTMMADEAPAEAPEADVEPSDDGEQPEAPEAEGDDEPEDWRSNFDPDKAGARIRKLQSEAKNLRDRAKTAEQKAASLGEKETRISELEAENLKYKVGYKIGLPAELVDRLRGKTEDDLVADAENLLKLVGGPKPAPGSKPVEALRGGGKPDTPPEERDVDKIGARMFRK